MVERPMTLEPTVTPEGVKLWEHQDEPGSYNTITLRYLDGEFVLIARHGLNFGRVTHTLTAEQVYDLYKAIRWGNGDLTP